jgi:hypothetical protein
MTKNEMKELALSCGFELKKQPSGELDLNPYVYDLMEAVIRIKDVDVDKLKSEPPSLPETKYRNYRDIDALFTAEYAQHIQAMTAEKLHSKSEMAVELAGRDREIAALNSYISNLEVENEELNKANEELTETLFEIAKMLEVDYESAKEEKSKPSAIYQHHLLKHDARVIEGVAFDLKEDFPEDELTYKWLIGLAHQLRQKAQEPQ